MADRMQTPNLDEIMSKIKKIRELATRGGTQHEAEVASAKMAELMLRYDISTMELDAHAESTDRVVTEDTFDFRANRWRQDLLFKVATAHSCKGIRINGIPPKSHWCRFIVVGHDHHLIVVRETWEWLQAEVLQLCAKAFKAAKAAGDWDALHQGESWQRAFHYGAVAGIQESYRAMKAQVKAEVGEERWALVPVMEGEVALRVEELFPTLGNIGRTPGLKSASAYDQGKKAGRAINLGKQVKGGKEAALAG
jgi:hypothetical protein